MSKKTSYNAHYSKDEKGVYTSDLKSLANPTHSVCGVVQLEPHQEVMYFEVTLIKTSITNPATAIGFAPPPPDWKSLGHCGWYDGSVAIHCDNGNMYDDFANSTLYMGQKFQAGDTVGAYWNTKTTDIFFTVNGTKIDTFYAYRNVPFNGKLLPTVTFDHNSSDQFSINYGEKPFLYDLSKEVRSDFDKKDFTELETKDENELGVDLTMFINRKEGSDVTILSKDGQTLYGHKLILSSRSKVLADMLTSKSNLELNFDKEIILVILEYIYSGKTLLTIKNWENVLKLADKLSLVSLRKVCFEFIVKTLNKNTVLDVMIKAQSKGYEFDATDLLERCVTYVEKKAYDIIKTESFLRLNEEVIILMLKNTNTCVDEFEMFNSCLKWANYQKEQGDKREVSEILKNIGEWIRYPQLTGIELVKNVKPSGICPSNLYKEALEYIAKPENASVEQLKKLQFQSRYALFKGTTILDNKGSWILRNWLPYSKKGWQLIYKATKDGFQSATFHQKCDSKGDTVTIIQSKNGYIFGGYNAQPWSQNGSYSFDQRCFLFSIVNKKGKAVKFDNYGTDRNSCYNSSGYGPTFGGGHDLYICDNSNSVNSSYCNSSYSYRFPTMNYGSSEAQAMLAGSYNFQTTEIEVFSRMK